MKNYLLVLFLGIFLLSFTSATITVTLNAPADASTQYVNPVQVNATGTASSPNTLTNLTFYDNSTGSWGARNTTFPITNNSFTLSGITASTESSNLWAGLMFKVLVNTNLTSVKKTSGATGNTAMLYVYTSGTSGNALANATFVGDIATFNYPLNTSATYFILDGDSGGASYTRTFSSGAISYPQNNSQVNVTQTIIFTSALITNNYRNIEGINTSVATSTATQLFNNTYSPGATILWNMQYCDNSSTCNFSSANRTFFVDNSAPIITLNYPTSLINYGANGSSLQLNFTATDTNLASVWYNYNGTNITITGATSGVANLSNITLSSKKNVTIYANDTAGNLNTTTFSWDYLVFENNRNYTSTTLSGSIELFGINITIDSASYPNIFAYLNYNGTNYSTTKYGSGDSLLFNTSLAIPSVTSSTNLSFYWYFVMTNTNTTSFSVLTTSSNQTVNPFLVGNCSGGYTIAILNYTLKDEVNDTGINGAGINGTISTNVLIYNSQITQLIANYSNTFSPVNNATICINQSIVNYNYSLYTTTTYSANGYSTRHNYHQNFSLGSTVIPQNVTLYLLPNAASTTFFMLFKGNTLQTIEGVLLNIQRQYAGQNGVYKTVEIEKTDAYGQATGYFDLLNNGIYSITATYNGTVIGTFNSLALYCITGQQCQINLYAAPGGTNIVNTSNLYNINYAYNLNESNRTVTFTFSTMDSSVSTFRLWVLNYDSNSNTTICNTSVTTSAGSLSCSIPSGYGNNTNIIYFYKDGTEILPITWSLGLGNYLGGNVVMIMLLLILTITMIFLPDIRVVWFMSAIGFIISGGLMSLSPSIIGTTTAATWLIVAVVILVAKYRSRE